MKEITLTAANFDDEVLAAGKPVLVDFWATWCGPCRMQGPVLSALAEKREDVLVGKVNVDEEPELANRYGIASIPTMILFKDGKPVETLVGFHPLEALEEKL